MTFSAQVEQWRSLVASIWPASQVDNVLAVMQCESGGDPNAHNTNGEDSRGLMQINVGPGAHTQWASYNLFDPTTNLQLAYQLWQQSGWAPWSCASVVGLTGGTDNGHSAVPGVLALLIIGLVAYMLLD